MTKINEATARQLRSMYPTQEDYRAAVDYLYSEGWQFKWDTTRTDKPAYSWGWWTKEGHPSKSLPRGDGGNFHLKAWDTLKAYVA
jgi:hypothetical protein